MNRIDWALHQFLQSDRWPPYQHEGVAVTVATLKASHVVARTGLAAHRVKGKMAAAHHQGKVRLAARFLCGAKSSDVVAVNEDQVLGYKCEPCHVDRTPCVYRHFDADDRLLYIGTTTRRDQRAEEHQKRSPWWDLVARVEYIDYPTATDARVAERLAIQDERPLHNKRWLSTAPP